LVICNDVLEHVKEKEPLIRKMNSVLKDGGLAFIKFPNAKSPVQYVLRDHPLLPPPLSARTMEKFGIYNITKKESLHMFLKCGFEPLDVTKEYFERREINTKMFSSSFSKSLAIRLWKIMRKSKVLAHILLYHAPQIVILARKVGSRTRP